MSETKILEGLKVLSFCHYLQGPAASQYLADMGADVIKVEPPKGAFERHWSGGDIFVDDVSAFFLAANRNKRSLAIDLKAAAALPIIRQLIKRSDVVLENYRPGVMEKLGLGYEAVRAINPRIVYASATGYGLTGPAIADPGQDLLVQARCGIMVATGPAGRPAPVGFAVADQHGAALLAMGILGAYTKALKTGEGGRVEASLLNAGIDLQTEALTLFYSGKQNSDVFRRDPHLATWFHQAPYGVYALADATVAVSLNKLEAFARALPDTRLNAVSGLDPWSERDRIATSLAELLAECRFEDVAAAFRTEGIWFQRVQDYDELRHDPQVVHNQSFQEVTVGEQTATLVRHPLRYGAGSTPTPPTFALRAGAHSAEILLEVGIAEDEIARLAEAGTIVIRSDVA